MPHLKPSKVHKSCANKQNTVSVPIIAPHVKRRKSWFAFQHEQYSPHTCKIPSMSEKLPVPATILTVQSHIPNRNFVVTIATLVNVNFCFHNTALSCFILNETFQVLQQQETLYFGYTNLGWHMQLQTSKSNHLCKQGCMCKLTHLYQFLTAWTNSQV